MGRRLIALLLFASLAVQVYGWTSHYCYVDAQRKVRRGGRLIWQPYQKRQCCNGWVGCYCHIALCSPQCTNGALCLDWNICSCPRGFKGSICQILHCGSWKKNCYPGTCLESGASCACADGFEGDDCNIIMDIPEYSQCKATVNAGLGGNEKIQVERCYVQDGPNDDTDKPRKGMEIDFLKENATVYSNANYIQNIILDWEALYSYPGQIPIKPSFVREVNTGIVSAQTNIYLRGEDGIPRLTKTANCANGGTRNDPRQSAQCRETIGINRQALHGDTLEIVGTATPGGFKQIKLDGGIGEYNKVNYEYGLDPAPTQTMYVKFDHVAPIVEGTSASFSTATKSSNGPLGVQEEFTLQDEILITWSTQWKDDISGIGTATFKGYKMELALDEELEQQEAEVCSGTYDWEDLTATCKPGQPGMYSIISRVPDKANNYALARTFAVVGPTPAPITRGDSFYSPDANPDADHHWIITLIPSDIKVTWKDHFQNDFVATNKYMSAAKPYTEPGTNRAVDYDDTDGILIHTGNSLNFNGVNQYELQSKVITGAGSTQPDGLWVNKGMAVDETISAPRQDGDTVQVWVRASDVFGHDIQDLLLVHVDSSPPVKAEAGSPVFQKNIKDSLSEDYDTYASRVNVQAEDPHSGIEKMDFKLLDAKDDTVLHEGSFKGQTCGTGSDPSCYCINPENMCFPKVQKLDLNNCWFKDRLGSTYRLEGRAFNKAYLDKEFTIHLGQVGTDLSGIGEYPGVRGQEQMTQGATDIVISWEFPQACYERKHVIITYTPKSGTPTTDRIGPNERNHTVTDLKPDKQHNIEVTIIYIGVNGNDERGEGVTFAVTTGRDDGPPMKAGSIVGIVLGLLILILLIIIIILMLLRYRQGKTIVPNKIIRVRDNIHNRIYGTAAVSSRNNDYLEEANIGVVKRPKVHNGQVNPAYDLNKLRQTYLDQFEDEVYAYGAMEFNSKANWIVAKEKVKLGDDISSGRLARIRHAKITDKKFKGRVVAKVLKDPDDDANRLLMTAKMNFLATVVPHHANLVNLVAAVPDEPFLLLEFCDYNLKTWLSEVEKVTPDVAEQLLHFCLDIAKGLQHMHSHDVLHRRLAARNVLLADKNGKLTAKLTGFGPMRGEGDDPKKEKIPVKWLAPESLEKEPGEQRTYSKETDMWTYGIVVWEIFSLGEAPYNDKAMADMKRTHASGYRLEPPEHASEHEYETLMAPCWQMKPGARPSAKEMVITLQKMFDGTPMDAEQYVYGDEAAQEDGQGDPLYENHQVVNKK